jgi:hypothetical protein
MQVAMFIVHSTAARAQYFPGQDLHATCAQSHHIAAKNGTGIATVLWWSAATTGDHHHFKGTRRMPMLPYYAFRLWTFCRFLSKSMPAKFPFKFLLSGPGATGSQPGQRDLFFYTVSF